ncbi:MAG TPA: ETC complex I subunit [Allosphingosinicella sp.]|nr:ETC complex I subunit [Allosphingosinicella sp.]
MAARIFQEARNAMQSGRAREGRWVLEFESHAPRRPDPLTGWSGGADTQAQVSIAFDTLEAARAYADREGVAYHVVPLAERKLRIQSYADNFR